MRLRIVFPFVAIAVVLLLLRLLPPPLYEASNGSRCEPERYYIDTHDWIGFCEPEPEPRDPDADLVYCATSKTCEFLE